MSREELLSSFLKNVGWNNTKKSLLAHDASFRWYDRLEKDNKTMVLMNAPIPQENPAQFVFVDKILENIQIKVPHIYHKDLENGFLLLEDFGDNTFTRLIAKGYNENKLYTKAVNTLIEIQKKIKKNPGLKEYNLDLILSETSLLPLWYIKYVVGRELSQDSMNSFISIWTKLYDTINQVPKTLVLLDYHVDNLMITKDNQCGLLDFQDARYGPVTYDLASLLEDARRPVSNKIQTEMLNLYFSKLPAFNTDAFKLSYPLMAVQRHSKVIGIFVRLFIRDHKDRYLKHIPFVWSLLEKHLDHPLLTEYKEWLDQYIPKNIRFEIPFSKEKTHVKN